MEKNKKFYSEYKKITYTRKRQLNNDFNTVKGGTYKKINLEMCHNFASKVRLVSLTSPSFLMISYQLLQ